MGTLNTAQKLGQVTFDGALPEALPKKPKSELEKKLHRRALDAALRELEGMRQ
jgi:hypothetical protein